MLHTFPRRWSGPPAALPSHELLVPDETVPLKVSEKLRQLLELRAVGGGGAPEPAAVGEVGPLVAVRVHQMT
ncbi:MAG: hypothetical protein WCQ44_13050, partial [Opitutaceae bacterium]